jgi:hypothetical protein
MGVHKRKNVRKNVRSEASIRVPKRPGLAIAPPPDPATHNAASLPQIATFCLVFDAVTISSGRHYSICAAVPRERPGNRCTRHERSCNLALMLALFYRKL